ncbi:hypothetical protein Godav_021869 [Gossypium davidsonii]|uniref:Peptidase A1 domain-containing protein n=1 Tax=Gossypium davidsonii TaxID=34287 RepID=A0A7J8TK10_GOSDV|nr:hypothetical protein [Gossypium davidsonii]
MKFEKLSYDMRVRNMEAKEECCEVAIHVMSNANYSPASSSRRCELIRYASSLKLLNQSEDKVQPHLPIGRVPKTFAYVVELKIESQCHAVKLLVDTGSSLIWTQCHSNECVYCTRYGAWSRPNSLRTKSVASFKAFQFPIDTVHTTMINDMIFRCFNDNLNIDFTNGQISRILGLSRGPDGLASQLAKERHH